MPSLDGFLKPRMLSWQDEWPAPTPYPVLRQRFEALGDGADSPLWTFHRDAEGESSLNHGDYPDVYSHFAERPSVWHGGGDELPAADAPEHATAMDRTFAASSVSASAARDGVARLNARMEAWKWENEGVFAFCCAPCTACGSFTIAFWYDALRAAALARAIDELNAEAAGHAVWGFAVVNGDDGKNEVAIALGARPLPQLDANVATVAGVELNLEGIEAVDVEPDTTGIAVSADAPRSPIAVVPGTVIAPRAPVASVDGTVVAPGATSTSTPVVVGSVVRSAAAAHRSLSRSISDLGARRSPRS